MVKYSCDKCGKEFTQKGHYTTHINKKNPCINENKLKELIDLAINEKIMKLNNKEETKVELNIEPVIESTTEPETETEPKTESTTEPKTELQKKTDNVKIVREEGLDKFYTIPSYSKKCIDKVFELYDISKWDLIIEPSAGDGSFLNQIESDKVIGIDISPKHNKIIKQDFLEYNPPENKKNILVIGNPPFGRISSLAIKFFNHSAKWSNMIAFIIPRTFRRISVQNKLNRLFHLVYDEEVPNKPCCFTPVMSAKCCFQIWIKKDSKRPIVKLPVTHEDWDFLKMGPLDNEGQPTPPTGADFALRAYGGKIGDIIFGDELSLLRPKSWHWIKINSNKYNKMELIDRFKGLDYSNSVNTARQNSMGRGDLVHLYTNSDDIIDTKL